MPFRRLARRCKSAVLRASGAWTTFVEKTVPEAYRNVRSAFIRRQLHVYVQACARDIEAALANGSGASAADLPSRYARRAVQRFAGARPAKGQLSEDKLLAELAFIRDHAAELAPIFEALKGKRVLYCGQAYYNAWYLSRALRARGWKADVLNWDPNPSSQIYYHGQDFEFRGSGDEETARYLDFFLDALFSYDIFHFSNAHAISFGSLSWFLQATWSPHVEIHLLKALGKRIVYSNSGCLDGVSQTSFARWGPSPACAICRWRDEPMVCSDERNLSFAAFRNSVADYQILLGGNRADYNVDPRVHECPGFYCLDAEVWRPDLAIPDEYRIERKPGRLLLYHAVGNLRERTLDNGVNIKSSHVWLPLVEKLQDEGWDLDLVAPVGVPNLDVRYLQAQADVFLEMLSFGWFGANAREAMMLGKPVICFIRPEWLESLRDELPGYAEELPVVSATPDTAEEVLRDLLANEEKRLAIGARSREFMLKWHSSEAGASQFDAIYGRLLAGDPLLGVEGTRASFSAS